MCPQLTAGTKFYFVPDTIGTKSFCPRQNGTKQFCPRNRFLSPGQSCLIFCSSLPSCRRPRAVALPPPPRRRSLVGCCVVVRRPISSSHAVMRPSTLSLPAAFADNLSSTASTAATAAAAGPPGHHNRHRHHRGRTHRRTLAKKAR